MKNTWGYVGYCVPGEFEDPTVTQSEEVASIPTIVGISHDNSKEEDEGVEFQE
jgi:hypothetical protein